MWRRMGGSRCAVVARNDEDGVYGLLRRTPLPNLNVSREPPKDAYTLERRPGRKALELAVVAHVPDTQ